MQRVGLSANPTHRAPRRGPRTAGTYTASTTAGARFGRPTRSPAPPLAAACTQRAVAVPVAAARVAPTGPSGDGWPPTRRGRLRDWSVETRRRGRSGKRGPHPPDPSHHSTSSTARLGALQSGLRGSRWARGGGGGGAGVLGGGLGGKHCSAPPLAASPRQGPRCAHNALRKHIVPGEKLGWASTWGCCDDVNAQRIIADTQRAEGTSAPLAHAPASAGAWQTRCDRCAIGAATS
jgi:hypothetical protein